MGDRDSLALAALRLAGFPAGFADSESWSTLPAPWEGEPTFHVWTRTQSISHQREVSLWVSMGGTTWIAFPTGVGKTAVPSSDIEYSKSMPVMACPPLDGSWSAPTWTAHEREEVLSAEQAADRFHPTSLRELLGPWLQTLTPEALRGALPLLHRVAFWSSYRHGLLEMPVASWERFEDVRVDIREDLARCEVHQRHDFFDEDNSLFVAPGALPTNTAEGSASEPPSAAFLLTRYSHPGESDGWTEQLHLVRLHRTRDSFDWFITRNLLWQRRCVGMALS